MLVSCARSRRSCTSLSTKKEGGEDDKEEKYSQVGVAYDRSVGVGSVNENHDDAILSSLSSPGNNNTSPYERFITSPYEWRQQQQQHQKLDEDDDDDDDE
jgi:hypothetical protein